MKIIITMIMVLMTQTALAWKWADAEVVSVKSFTDQPEHYVHVKKFSNPNKCKNNNAVAVVRNQSSNWKMVHENILAGFLAGKKIRFRVNGCRGNYAMVDGVQISN